MSADEPLEHGSDLAGGWFPELGDLQRGRESRDECSVERPGLVALLARRRKTLEWAPRWCRSAGLEVEVVSPKQAADQDFAGFDAVLIEASLKYRRSTPLYEWLIKRDDAALGEKIFVICASGREIERAKLHADVEVVAPKHDWELVSRRLLRHVSHRRAVDSLIAHRARLRDLRGFADHARDRLATEHSVEPISGLPNRDAFHGIVERSLVGSDPDMRVAVVVIGFSRFGLVVDALGETEARRLVKVVGERLAQCIARPLVNDHQERLLASVIGNLGQTRFGAMLSWSGKGDQLLTAFRQQLMAVLEQPTAVGGRMMNLSGCLGIAVYPDDTADVDQLVQRADDAMREAELRGGGFRYHAPRELDQESAARLQMEHELHGALQKRQLALHYQPIVRMADHRIVAAEALLRWPGADGRFVSPEVFVPIAEESSLIHRLGEWVIDQVCKDINDWLAQGVDVPTICINVARAQLITDQFIEYLADRLNHFNIAPDRLELEISERGVLARSQDVQDRLVALKSLGVRLTVDDFGAGDSSIDYLRTLPIDGLKVDKSYTRELGAPGRAGRLLAAILAMAKALDIQSIVEGVETARELRLLAPLGCYAYQGFVCSEAVPAQQLVDVIASSNRAGRQLV